MISLKKFVFNGIILYIFAAIILGLLASFNLVNSIYLQLATGALINPLMIPVYSLIIGKAISENNYLLYSIAIATLFILDFAFRLLELFLFIVMNEDFIYFTIPILVIMLQLIIVKIYSKRPTNKSLLIAIYSIVPIAFYTTAFYYQYLILNTRWW